MGLEAEQIFLGLMSGTSCDGLDLALVAFSEHENAMQFRWIDQTMIPYTDAMQKRLLSCSQLEAHELALFENEWTIRVASEVNTFLHNQIEKPVCIGFHGHTVFHRPEFGYTVQMGSGATLASLCGIDVVCNFRQQDVAAGGQGAPLVPVAERDLFPQYDAFLNLGGFANATMRDKTGIRAFDICAANIVLNKYARQLGLAFDRNGDLARSGMVNRELLDLLIANSLKARGQELNSLGVEWVEETIIPVLDNWLEHEIMHIGDKQKCIAQVLASYTEFIAIECARQFFEYGRVLVSGGGAHNGYLVERMQIHTQAKLFIADARITDFKEALAFAYLAYCRINSKENTVVSVTGAKQAHISGGWYKA